LGVYEYEDVGDVRNGRCRTTGASAPVFLCPGKDWEEGMSGGGAAGVGRGGVGRFGWFWGWIGGWDGRNKDRAICVSRNDNGCFWG